MAGFGGGSFNNTGFQVTYGGTLGLVNVSVLLGVQDFTAGASGFTGETDKGGAVDNQGTVTRDRQPSAGRHGSRARTRSRCERRSP